MINELDAGKSDLQMTSELSPEESSQPTQESPDGEVLELSAPEQSDSEEEVQSSFPGFDPMAAGKQIAAETVVFEIHFRRPGFRKSIPSAHFMQKIKEADEQDLTDDQRRILEQYKSNIVKDVGPDGEMTDATMLHVSQDILDCKEISEIYKLDGKFSGFIKGFAIPSPMLAHGMFQIRLSRVEMVDQAVQEFLEQRQALIQAFRVNYETRKEEAKKRRWPFYNESDYPVWNEIESKYKVEAQYLTFNVPAALEQINKSIYEREQKKVQLQWANAAQEARDAQRIAFQELMEHCSTMLGKDESGKRKTFSSSAIKKLQEFLTMFEEFNLTGDVELEQIIKKTKDVISGVDVKDLKKDISLRDVMLDSVSKLKEQAAGLVVTKKRKVFFSFDAKSENNAKMLEAAKNPKDLSYEEILDVHKI